MKQQESKSQEILQTLLESLAGSNMKVTVTIEPVSGLTAEQVEKARQAGREGTDIYFGQPDSTL